MNQKVFFLLLKKIRDKEQPPVTGLSFGRRKWFKQEYVPNTLSFCGKSMTYN